MTTNKLRHALDRHVPGMDDPCFEQKVLRRIREEQPRPALPKGWVLALVLATLLLASVTAVASAWLTGRQVVEEYALPMSDQSPGNRYTMVQTKTLLDLAQENGLTLSDSTLQELDRLFAQGEGFYKEEMIMAIAKAAFGPLPAAWTLEQQSWFDDACVAIGFIPGKEKAIPEQGEDGRGWAIALAQEHIRATHGDLTDLEDPTVYEPAGVQYLLRDEQFPVPYYSVCFVPLHGTEKALSAAEYWVYLDDAGHVLEAHRRPGAEPGVHTMWVTDAYVRCYGVDRSAWSQQAWRGYRQAMLQCTETPDDMYTLLCLKLSDYPDIAENALTRASAAQLALQAVQQEGATVYEAYYLGAEPNPLWKVVLRLPDDNTFAAVEVDSVTGEVSSIVPCRPNDRFLQQTHEEADRLYQEYLQTLPGNG